LGGDGVSVGSPGQGATVVLYTRPGCHLCDEARAELEGLRAEHGFALVERDIEADERLRAAYHERVPVVELDGEVVSELWLDQGALQARLDTVSAMGSRRPRTPE
jgi:glutaredoxin